MAKTYGVGLVGYGGIGRLHALCFQMLPLAYPDLPKARIDLTLHLLGSISTVAARTRTVVPERPGPDGKPQLVTSDDVAWLELGLANGARGTLEASKMVPGAGDDLRVEAYGTRGTLIFDTRNPNQLYVADEHGGRQIATWSRTTPAASLPGGEMSSGWIQWHAASIATFLDALGSDAEPNPSLEAGLNVDRVIDAAFASTQQDGRYVEV